MRYVITLLLLVALPTSLLAQDPAPPPKPLTDQGLIIEQEIVLSRELTLSPPPVAPLPTPTRPAYQRKLFWLGLGIALAGTVFTGLALTKERESDLSDENPNARINVHLAPCGTDPAETTLPIADCKTHTGLLYFGLGMTAAGSGLVWYAIDSASAPTPAPMLKYSVRF